MWRGFVRYGALACAIACGESTAPPPACDGAINISVAITLPPRFDWSPACGVSSVSVATVEPSPLDERVVWGFAVPEQRPIGPPVVYGARPSGATVWTGPEPLEVGKQYRVSVMYTIGGDGVAASGERTFTWFPPD